MTVKGDGFESLENVEVVLNLPSYMTMMDTKELEELENAQSQDNFIVAAGFVPGTSEILFLTSEPKLLSIDAEMYHIPSGDAVPIRHGSCVLIGGWEEVPADFIINRGIECDMSRLA